MCCLFLRVCVCVCVHVRVRVHVCACVHVHVHVCMHVCVAIANSSSCRKLHHILRTLRKELLNDRSCGLQLIPVDLLGLWRALVLMECSCLYFQFADGTVHQDIS